MKQLETIAHVQHMLQKSCVLETQNLRIKDLCPTNSGTESLGTGLLGVS